jgi:SAM-dependent methyltransferase
MLGGRISCGLCGAATTDPWPSDDDLELAYGEWYRPRSGRFAVGGDALLRRTRGRLAARLDRIAPAGAILDIGSGDGALLDAFRAVGRDAVGLERQSNRPDVLAKDVSEMEGPFAAVVFWHSLEHLRAPGAAIDHAARLLCPEGILCVAVPNAESLQARAFGDDWFALDLPRHLVHLPARALVERVERLGLRVERVSHLRGGQVLFGWLHGLVGALPGRLDLYAAIRQPDARSERVSPGRRLATLAAGVAALPAAVACTATEVAARRGGTVYVEARRG